MGLGGWGSGLALLSGGWGACSGSGAFSLCPRPRLIPPKKPPPPDLRGARGLGSGLLVVDCLPKKPDGSLGGDAGRSLIGDDGRDLVGSGAGDDGLCSSMNFEILFMSSFLGDEGGRGDSSPPSAAFDCWLMAASAATCSWTLVGERGRVLMGVSTMAMGRPGVMGTSSVFFLDESTREMTLPMDFDRSCTCDFLESTRGMTSGRDAGKDFDGLGGVAGFSNRRGLVGFSSLRGLVGFTGTRGLCGFA